MNVYVWDCEDSHLRLGFAYQWDGSEFAGRAKNKMAIAGGIEQTIGHCAITLVDVESGPEIPTGLV